MKMQRAWIRSGLMAGVMVAGVLWAGDRGAAFNPQPDPPGFAMFGITSGQTARLNVVNVTDGQGVGPSPFRVTLQLTFLDSMGNVLAQSMETVDSGQAAYLDLDGATLGVRADPRTQIRGMVAVMGSDRRSRRRDEPVWAASLEVFDNVTAATGFMHPSVLVGFNPQPDPPGR